MSAPRRPQLRDHLGRFASPSGASGAERGPAGRRAGRRPGRQAAGGLGRWVGGIGRAARLLSRALRGELARRLYRLAVVAVALAAAVVLLYEHGDSPGAFARSVQAAPSTGPSEASPRTAGAGPTAGAAGEGNAAGNGEASGAGGASSPDRPAARTAGDTGPGPAAARPARPAQPAGVAAAWYAARHHLEPGRVRPLQQDKLSNREVRVLVLADRGDGRLDTALVTVRRDAKGRWSVP
jgi:hypothetical protein